MTPREVQDSVQRLRGAIFRLSRKLRSTESERAAGLPPARVSVLLAVEREGPVRLGRIAEREGLNPTMLSRIVGHLVDDGLVDRRVDPEDRRTAWLDVTGTGRELALGIRARRTRSLEHSLRQLTEQQREQLDAALPALESLADALGA